MVARAQASQSNISVLIDPDTILLPDFAITLHNALQLEHDWLLVSIPRSVSTLSETGKQFLTEDGGGIKFEELRKILVRDLHSSSCSDRALIAWNKGNLSLHSIFLPPFINGKGLHNQWLIHQALASDLRLVIDASESISSFYPEVSEHGQLLRESDRERSNESPWESNVNARLAASYGSLGSSPDKYSNLVRLVVCFALHIFYDSTKDTVYVSHQHGRSGPNKVPGQDQGHSLKLNEEKRWRNCIGSTNLPHREDKCSLTEWLRVNSRVRTQVGLPFSLESLLQITADENRTIVLAVAGYSYKDMLMSWVCRMRHLSVTNFLIGALDSDIYDFSVLQGLPVFKDPLPPANIRLTSCHFGTDCFRKVSKVKSRLVLQILRMGYNVLLSDVDVYWFQNPLPFLQKFDPPVLLAQSDEYNETGPINLPRRLNSGFYYARADPPTIAAFAKVVKHASTSNMSEQPSFYDILCGVGGTHRTSDEHCVEPETNLRVIFLDRNLFPNGAFRSLWLERDVRRACKALGCLILHNNWISGKDNKVKRQIRSGLWAYDVHSRMCLQGPKMVSP
ncbi:unnamed protein product [Spirodela intermedia]|uniref:Nucleotide-diphospho-sugar transferase domain-containing protein n=1 Tax=Spirodela intermedia TaxID=51605 RepID=A0A7I8L664_SPIIN|nr:unnamed protein product [Spirodela intermedia]